MTLNKLRKVVEKQKLAAEAPKKKKKKIVKYYITANQIQLTRAAMNMIHHFEEQIKHDDPQNFGSEIDFEESSENTS